MHLIVSPNAADLRERRRVAGQDDLIGQQFTVADGNLFVMPGGRPEGASGVFFKNTITGCVRAEIAASFRQKCNF
ncbi:hypothetical protein V4R08_10690 [Nitrobacter sp. NHB1]|uniref:hypothetical protein n=1 Tax=Nitrobacter sp. NHB1 TaxID=3119830 RepID=UPI00300096A1